MSPLAAFAANSVMNDENVADQQEELDNGAIVANQQEDIDNEANFTVTCATVANTRVTNTNMLTIRLTYHQMRQCLPVKKMTTQWRLKSALINISLSLTQAQRYDLGGCNP